MGKLGSLELMGGWNPTVKIFEGAQNTLTYNISRWSRFVLADNVRYLIISTKWSEQVIGSRGSDDFDIIF